MAENLQESKTLRTLVIDDDKNFLAHLKEQNSGKIEFTTVNKNDLFIRALYDDKFDVVICDLNMPEISGSDLIAYVKDKYPYLPVIAITGMPEKFQKNALLQGADDIIIKGNKKLKNLVSIVTNVYKRNQIKFEESTLEGPLNKFLDNVLRKYFVQNNIATTKFSNLLDKKNYLCSVLGTSELHMSFARRDVLELSLLVEIKPEHIAQALIAAQFHDYKKIFWSKEFILSPVRPNPDEVKNIIYPHVTEGKKDMKKYKGLELAAEIIGQHHENYDGTGYPNGLKQDEILPETEIVKNCIEFYSLLLGSPRKEPKSFEKVIKTLKTQKYYGGRLNPEIADVYINYLSNEKRIESVVSSKN